MNNVERIRIDKIVPNRSQPRLDFYDESITGLAESIKENGLLQPVSVRKIGDHYELIAGERRYRACKLNGYDLIDAIVYDMSDEDSANLALIENLQREDLNAIEQAMAMVHLMDINNLTQTELAVKLGYKQSTIANKVRLLRLPDYVKDAVNDGSLSERHARALLKVEEENMEMVFHTILDKGYNVAKTEEYIKALQGERGNRGVSSSTLIGVNTLKQAYEMCRKSGLDCDFQMTEYGDSLKVTIRFRK